MGHYDDCRAEDDKRRREENERRVEEGYQRLRSSGKLTDDKLKDAVLYLLRESTSFGSLKTEADIHIRRLEGRIGFEK